MQHTWLDTTEYPFTSRYFTVNGHQLHYLDEGKGELLLFVHGTPSWSFDFRKVIQELSKNYRCLAIDHIGFGLSDKPESYDYSTLNHSKTLQKFILQNDLKDITLVLHDFGGPIGFAAALNHPDRIHSIVVLNSWLWSSQDDPDYIALRKILKSPLLPFLYLYLNFSATYILPRSFGDHKLSRAIHRHYTRPFGKRSERSGPLAFARSLVKDQDWFEELWKRKSVLSEKNILLIWGMKDPVVKPSYLEKFCTGFPHATVKKLATAGHFPQEELPQEVAQCIHTFLSKRKF